MRPAAILDVDGTLIEGSLGIEFTQHYFGEEYPFKGGIDEAVQRWQEEPGYSYSKMATDIVKHWSHGLKGLESEEVRTAAREFVEGYDIPDSNRELVAQLEKNGFDIYIVSLNPEEVLEPYAGTLGGDITLYGTRAEEVDGTYTGELELDLTTEEGKNAAIREIEHLSSLEDGTALGDTKTDAPLLEAVGKPILVNPSEELVKTAKEKGWNHRSYSSLEELLEAGYPGAL